jgi:hypothetical protein
MEAAEARAHSFILKLWCEESADDGRLAIWRGRIAHVPSGDCRYVQDFAALVGFLVPYLEELGVRRPNGRAPGESWMP